MNTTCIIGTAGHVDHGKTRLIQALTGIDTDRLAEEKKRGITIELGFAHLLLPNGAQVGIVDVPGHERFIKNMLCGAGGVDIAMLIVASDEGMMPQTLEHLNILQLLDVPCGIIVLTKVDLVEADWLELVVEQISQAVQGTFLSDAKIIPTCALTGQGLEQIKQQLVQLMQSIKQKDCDRPFRIPVDRIFSVDGFGSVVTGTLIEGSVSLGEDVMLYPQQKKAKVRNIQVHSQNTGQAFAGQRTAINLAGLKKTDIVRGNVLAPAHSLQSTMMLDVLLRVLPDCDREIKNGSRVHFYHGAQEVLCKAVLLDSAALQPGQSGYAQLRMEEEIVCKPRDRFVVRFYSPLETIGGGVVLDVNPSKHKQFALTPDPALRQALRIKQQGDLTQVLEQYCIECSPAYLPLDGYALRMGERLTSLAPSIAQLQEQGRILAVSETVYLHLSFVERLQTALTDFLRGYHSRFCLLRGIKKQELKSKLFAQTDNAIYDALLQGFANRQVIHLQEGIVSLYGFAVQLTGELAKCSEDMEAVYRAARYAPPATEEVLQRFARCKEQAQVLASLLERGRLVKLDDQTILHCDHFDTALQALRAHVAASGSITLGEFRDALQTSRKYAVAMLEYLDRQAITKKVGDTRVLR